ncbi:YybH family protein [Roseateles sp. DXS20W]|uniref:YybH family protein n=1 Tax=Pelomonas lactea TaxID=3299030 RepID=A0ABW7GMU6_9BURK
MLTEEDAIRAVHTTFIDAVNAGRLQPLLGMMTDDVVFFSPGQAPFGREGFPAGFEAGHRDFQLRCISDLEEVVVAADVAYTRARDTLTLTPRAGGATTQLAGHRMTVYRRQPDGAWRMARDVHTLMPVAG